MLGTDQSQVISAVGSVGFAGFGRLVLDGARAIAEHAPAFWRRPDNDNAPLNDHRGGTDASR